MANTNHGLVGTIIVGSGVGMLLAGALVAGLTEQFTVGVGLMVVGLLDIAIGVAFRIRASR